MISGIGSTSYASYLQPMPKSGPDPKEMFSTLDADSSGGLSETELSVWAEEMSAMSGTSIDTGSYSDYDTDQDGELSETEMQSFVESLGPPRSQMPLGASGEDDLFSALDMDQSGTVTQAELDEWAANMAEETGTAIDVSEVDTDGSGEISSEEFSSFMEASGSGNAPPPPPGGAGGAEADESETTASSILSQYDTDGDGVLSSSELQAMLEDSDGGLFKALIQKSISAYETSSETHNYLDIFANYGQDDSGYSPIDLSA